MKAKFRKKAAIFSLALLLLATPAVQGGKSSRKFLRAAKKGQQAAIRQAKRTVPVSKTTVVVSPVTVEIRIPEIPVFRPEVPFSKTLSPAIPELDISVSKALNQAIFDGRKVAPAKKAKRNRKKETPREQLPLPFKKEEKLQDILDNSSSLPKALEKIWALEEMYGRRDFFRHFIDLAYRKHFPIMTPHLRELFSRVASLRSRDVEMRLIKRLRFLVENTEGLRNAFSAPVSKKGLRIRYLKDITTLDADNFDAKDLIFSFERRMNPGAPEASLNAITVTSSFPSGNNRFPIYMFADDPAHLPNLYRYLLNGKKRKSPLLLVFDEQYKSMAIYNQEKNLWLRITPHEIVDINRLHIHLNQISTVSLTTTHGQQVTERVNYNLSIQVGIPSTMPEGLSKEDRADFLYKAFILNPVKHFEGDQHVRILRRGIF